ncbi:MAG: hypothetical protein FJX29_10295 [Alphaproteobacteria bacterium]|nr:hypothetical protein [Alphaproteobacteria bacterium]
MSQDSPRDCDSYRQLAASTAPLPAGISASDYDAIEDAVMETSRGRGFLKEYARRVRAAETAGLLAALERIEGAINRGASPFASVLASVPRETLARMAGVSEKLFDVVWYMRERGFDGSICEAISTEARVLGEISRGLQGVDAAAGETVIAEPEFIDIAPAARTGAPEQLQEPVRVEVETQSHTQLPAQPAEALFTDASLADAQPAQSPAAAVIKTAEPEMSMQAQDVMARQLAAFSHIEAMAINRKLPLFV